MNQRAKPVFYCAALFGCIALTCAAGPVFASPVSKDAAPGLDEQDLLRSSDSQTGEAIVDDVTTFEGHDSLRSEVPEDSAIPVSPLEAASVFELDSIFAELEKLASHQIDFRYFLNPAGEYSGDIDKRIKIESDR